MIEKQKGLRTGMAVACGNPDWRTSNSLFHPSPGQPNEDLAFGQEAPNHSRDLTNAG